MPRISIGDCEIFYERRGSGPTVMLVSGLGGVAAFWKEQVPTFAREFDVVTHDHRGVGQSDRVRMAYSVEQMAADLLALMDALGVAQAHIVGHSTGAAIAQILSADHPDRVSSAVLLAGWTKADAYFRRLFAMRKEVLAEQGPGAYLQCSNLFLFPAEWISENNERLQQQEAQSLTAFSLPEIVQSRIDAVLAFDRTADLGRIRTPTLVVGAVDDMTTPAYHSEQLARLIPGAELKLFAGGGHCFPQTRGRELNAAVMPFLMAHTPKRM